MKRKLITGALTLPMLLATGIGQAAENEVQDQLNAIEKRLDRIDDKAQNQIKSVSESAFKLQDRFKINGFASFGVNTSDEEKFTPYFTQINDKESYLEDSILGIQMTFKVNDKLDAVAQLIAEAKEDYNLKAEWAYLSYQVNDDWKVRAGRLRVPFYAASEYLDVGYAYPWARPPLEIYTTIPFKSYNGFDTFYNFNASGFDITLQAMHGIEHFTNPTGAFDTIMTGAYVNVNYDDFSFRVGRTHATINGEFAAPDGALEQFEALAEFFPEEVAAVVDIFSLKAFDVDYSGIALGYDNGSLLILTEATDLVYNDVDLTRIFAANATIGYRYNQWLPYVGVSRTYTTEEANYTKVFGAMIVEATGSIGFAPMEQTTYSAGLRWDIKQGVSIKTQWDHITDLADTTGLLASNEMGATPDNGINIYSLVIDAVF